MPLEAPAVLLAELPLSAMPLTALSPRPNIDRPPVEGAGSGSMTGAAAETGGWSGFSAVVLCSGPPENSSDSVPPTRETTRAAAVPAVSARRRDFVTSGSTSPSPNRRR